MTGTKRFSELKRSVSGVSQKVLTQSLRSLEDDGLISRKVYAEIPPRVEYSMTDLGALLHPVLDALAVWGNEYKASLKDDGGTA